MSNQMSADMRDLLNLLSATNKKYDLDMIVRAYEYARDLHEGQYRVSGEPYISHPIAVAEIVAGLELDTDSICAALLHDTVEDCSDKTNLKEIEKLFGKLPMFGIGLGHHLMALANGAKTYKLN